MVHTKKGHRGGWIRKCVFSGSTVEVKLKNGFREVKRKSRKDFTLGLSIQDRESFLSTLVWK